MYLESVARDGAGIDDGALEALLRQSLRGRAPRRALIVPPDITRLHSGAGRLANLYYRLLSDAGCAVEVIPALGTHAPMTRAEAAEMFGDIPFECFCVHRWREDPVRLGEVPGEWIAGVSEGLWTESIAVEINRRIVDPEVDLVLSIGQVVPHEVAGMAGHAKNLFVGLGGSDMINKSHMLGAVYGLERVMGRDHAPVRRVFDYALERFLSGRPILFALTVMSDRDGRPGYAGVFIGDTRRTLESAVALSQKINVSRVPGGIRKCVAYLDPREFRSTWLGNKAIYRTRMAIADGGELLILAPGVERFGEDPEVDRLIRKYGYRGRLATLARFNDSANGDLRANMCAAAHVIHGSADGRFDITYAAGRLSRAEVENAGFRWADCDAAMARYDPRRLRPGPNTLADGEEVYFIPNPAAGLWTREQA